MKIQILKFCLSLLMVLAFNPNSMAQNISEPSHASEYIFKISNQDKIVSVQVLGAVAKPGIYNIPASTGLLKLITLAGGITNETDGGTVMIRKAGDYQLTTEELSLVSKNEKSLEVEIEDLINKGSNDSLKLNHEDLVYVPKKEPLIGNDLVRVATVVSVILSAVLTGMIIDDRLAN